MADERAGYGALSMRFSFSVLLLGWWMVKQRWMSSGKYEEPSISVKPGTVVALGENATIHCKFQYSSTARFFLFSPTHAPRAVLASYEAVFPIANIKQADQGNYRCMYCFKYCSYESAELNIQLAAQVYPKPLISVDPDGILTIGGSAGIHCNSENNSQTGYYLYKQGASLLQKVENIKSTEAVFRFTNAQQSTGGIYWCTYCFDSNSDKQCSNFSDKIYINITDPSLREPSISGKPRMDVVLDSDVIIECEGPENGLNFSLHKASHLIASQTSEPSRNVTNFALSMKRLEDAGNYTCRYHHRGNSFVWSQPSNPVELIVTERSMTTVWAGCAAGLLLVVLLLLLAFIVYRKRRKGPKISERRQVIKTPLEADAQAVYEEVSHEAGLDGVIYAILNQDSLKIKRTTASDVPPESCVYASVAADRNKEGH